MNGTKELADSNHNLKGVVGNVILYFDLRMVSQTNTCMPGKEELVGSGGDSRRELMGWKSLRNAGSQLLKLIRVLGAVWTKIN